jgi:hypothetical protein
MEDQQEIIGFLKSLELALALIPFRYAILRKRSRNSIEERKSSAGRHQEGSRRQSSISH